jgi:hypothetical protein
MNKGISLHIGVNSVDPNIYGNWEGKLSACEADAKAMHKIAKSQGYHTNLLLTKEAKRETVLDNIYSATRTTEKGDIFFISFAGHGGQVPDVSGDEIDKLDETWCLYDGQLLDDELTYAFSKFKQGVRVLLISDSCHSGTVSRSNDFANEPKQGPDGIGFRCMYPKEAFSAYRTNRSLYDEIKRDMPNPLPNPLATVKSITACRDDERAADGKKNGFFTTYLLKVWKEGRFDGDYDAFFRKLESKMKWKTLWDNRKQHPTFHVNGPQHEMFDLPFKI